MKNIRIEIACVTALLILSMSSLGVSANNIKKANGIRYTDSNTTIYSSWTGKKKVKTVLGNYRVSLKNIKGKRYQINFNGKKGYVNKSALSNSPRKFILYSQSFKYQNKNGQHVLNDHVYTKSYLGSKQYKLTDGRTINSKLFNSKPALVTVKVYSHSYGLKTGFKYPLHDFKTTGIIRKFSYNFLLFEKPIGLPKVKISTNDIYLMTIN